MTSTDGVSRLAEMLDLGTVLLLVIGIPLAFAVFAGVAALTAVVCAAELRRHRVNMIGDESDPAERANRAHFVRRMLTCGGARDADGLSLTLRGDGAFTDVRAARAYSKYRAADEASQQSDTFLLSLFCTYWTRSAFFGWALGGSLAGSLLGWILLPGSSRASESSSSDCSTRPSPHDALRDACPTASEYTERCPDWEPASSDPVYDSAEASGSSSE